MELHEYELDGLYSEIELLHSEHLERYGINLPKLRHGGNFTVRGIVLCFLFKYAGIPVSKSTLTEIVRQWHPDINDVQEARHLARQKGFNILSGTRGDIWNTGISLKKSEYCLVNLTEPYPGFSGKTGHRSARGGKTFEAIKENYNNRCATCGSLEGERNFLNDSITTELQEAHMNPNLRLTEENTIPQCSECNRAYRDWFIFDGNGRVTNINIKSPRWRKIYKLIG